MHRKSEGFTLVEVMIVVTIIAILAAVAIPNLISARINANEAAAISTLKSLVTTQMHARVSGMIDSNGDGVGEYGYFQELAGFRETREDSDRDGLADSESNIVLDPPAISGHFGDVDTEGLMLRSGYMFRLYLPGGTGEFLRERSPSEQYPPVSGELAANYWACYAWPANYGATGRRAFFVNQEGQILACRNDATRYSGYNVVVASFALPFFRAEGARPRQPKRTGKPADQTTAPQAALLPGSSVMSGPIAVNTVGQDGNRWTTVH